MSDQPNSGGGPQKSGVGLNADPEPKPTGQSTDPTGTRSFGDPPDSGGSPPKSGVKITNPPADPSPEK